MKARAVEVHNAKVPRSEVGTRTADIIETESSGAVVARDTRTIPMISLGIFSLWARDTELSTKRSAHFASTMNAQISRNQARGNETPINSWAAFIRAALYHRGAEPRKQRVHAGTGEWRYSGERGADG